MILGETIRPSPPPRAFSQLASVPRIMHFDKPRATLTGKGPWKKKSPRSDRCLDALTCSLLIKKDGSIQLYEPGVQANRARSTIFGQSRSTCRMGHHLMSPVRILWHCTTYNNYQHRLHTTQMLLLQQS